MKILKPHQLDTLKYLARRFCGALLLEMRLGKNLIIIRFLALRIKPSDRVLFITQFGAMQSIEDELISENIKVTVLTGTRQKRLNDLATSRKTGGWVISNYESAQRLMLCKENWKAVILDETIKIANPKSTITKHMLLPIWKKVSMRYILNGKVNPESIFQICTQFLFIHDTYMGCKSFWQYRAKYFIQSGDWDWVPKPGHKKAVYEYVQKNAFVLLRKDANIGPDKLYDKRYIPTTPELRKHTKALATNFEINGVQYKNEMGVAIGMAYLAGGIMPGSLDKFIDKGKYNELLYMLKNEFLGEKVLIWCKFKAEVFLIQRKLWEDGVRGTHITGDDSKDERKTKKKEFETNPNLQFAVLTIASSCKGQDWSIADTAIYYSNEWSNDFRGQSEDRLVHLNKKEPILIVDLIRKDSTDEDVVAALRSKEFDSNLIMSKFLSQFRK